MAANVAVPVWAFLLLLLLAAAAVLEWFLLPSVRWFFRQRTDRLLDELGRRLRLEIQPFQRTRRAVLVDRLIFDPKVQEAAEAHAREHGLPRELVMATVRRYAREIVPAFNAYLYFRFGYWAGRRIAQMLYRVRMGYSDEEGLAAIPRGSTVVFVMNHRSNMDYVIVGYLAADRAALSYAVGEWARIWPLRALIRSMGAYFVRRHSRDALYRRVLERYVCMATEGGVTQAVYPEGGLSRNGGLREPKFGLLDYMLRGFDPEGERDLVFVPVGVNYDRTLEDRTLLLDAEQETPRPAPGRGKAIRTVFRFVAHNLALMARNRWHRFGYACVNFGPPISMRDYCGEKGLDFRRLPRDRRRACVEALGTDLMAAVGRVVPVLPVALVATVLLESARKPVSELGLKARVHGLIVRLEAEGAHVYIPRSDRDYAVAVGLRMLALRRLVEKTDGLYVAREAELPLLRYYANSIAHLLPADAAATGGAR